MPFLQRFRALDLTDLTGQFCGKLLVDLGMEVLKIEPPGGDPVRRMGPFKDDKPHIEGSLRFAYLNAGKRSVTLDIGCARGREILLKLVENVDVLIESYAPGRRTELGLTDEVLHERNPGLVITSVTGFGQSGPHANYAWTDMVGLAMGGLMFISGAPDLPPVKPPETQGYYFSSIFAAYGTLLALWDRRREDRGQTVDVSVQEAIASQEHMIRTAGFDGQSIRRHGSQHEHVSPANIFPARDGFVYLFVSRQHWRRFLTLWSDHPVELDAPELELNHVRHARADWINEQVSEYTRQFAREEFTTLMQEHGIPALPVNAPGEFASDEHVRARAVFGEVDSPFLGRHRQANLPLLLDGVRPATCTAPLLGQHTLEVLRDGARVEQSEMEALFAASVV